MITALLFLYVGGSAYAECIVDGTSYDVGGTGVTTVDRGNPITLAIIKDNWDTSGDDITTCDVSNITDMTFMFKDEDAFNQDISTWDVSNVTRMYGMFWRADAFNQDISSWNVSNDLYQLFRVLIYTALANTFFSFSVRLIVLWSNFIPQDKSR